MNASNPISNTTALVQMANLNIAFQTRQGEVTAVREVNWQLHQGEMLGIVGESGSGKSVTSLALIGLLDHNGRISQGDIHYQGVSLSDASEREQKRLRQTMAMIFQYPRMALNPIRQVGAQLIDVLQTLNPRQSKAEFKRTALALLEEVHIHDPEQRFYAYPFELSGGMCQRILIAMALARAPQLLIADEPTTGLDVVTQEAIMSLITEAARARNMATLFITHDLGLAAKYCQRLVVMEKGKIVEQGAAEQIFRAPKAPYTRALIAATPALMSDLNQLREVMALGESHAIA